MAYERRTFAGAAVATTLNGSINGAVTSIVIDDATGWPTGSGGDFFVVIDRGLATEEKVLIDTRSTLTLTVASSGRGSDGTAATSHADGATIELCIAARDVDEPNAHIANTGLDHHTQYLNTARHDVEARHTFGAALGTPATPSNVSTAVASTGSGNNPAREDHVHGLADDAVTTAKIADGAVTLAKLAPHGAGTVVGYGRKIANQSLVGATVITDLTDTFTALADHSYEIGVTLFVLSGVDGYISTEIKRGATVVQRNRVNCNAVSDSAGVSFTTVDEPGAGSVTYTVEVTDSTDGDVIANANVPGILLIKALGEL